MQSVFLSRYVRLFLAEVLGTFLLVLIGDGAVAQVVLGNVSKKNTFFGGFLNIALGYGLALMVGICASGGISGGHLNPAVSLAMGVVKKLEWRKVPLYMAAQYLGAFLGAVVLWGNYKDAITMAEEVALPSNSTGQVKYTSATQGIFATYPFFDVEKVWHVLV